MSTDFQRLSSSQNLSQATQQKKVTKVGTKDIQLDEFKDSDHHKGYLCYDCVYFVKPHHCAIVTDEGIDIQDNISGVITPHGLCSIWTQNKEEIHGDATSREFSAATAAEVSTSGLSDKSTLGISGFSCGFCDKTFNSREY